MGSENNRTIVVDDSDVERGIELRHVVEEKNLRYRVSALWLKNSKGKILLARRAYTKKHSPGKWGPAVAGTNEEGESYEDNIIKEAREELGITHMQITIGPKVKIDSKYRYFVQWFIGVLDWPESKFRVKKDEVAQIKWFSEKELKDAVADNPEKFTSNMHKYLELLL